MRSIKIADRPSIEINMSPSLIVPDIDFLFLPFIW